MQCVSCCGARKGLGRGAHLEAPKGHVCDRGHGGEIGDGLLRCSEKRYRSLRRGEVADGQQRKRK